jgi:hypothetical protein
MPAARRGKNASGTATMAVGLAQGLVETTSLPPLWRTSDREICLLTGGLCIEGRQIGAQPVTRFTVGRVIYLHAGSRDLDEKPERCPLPWLARVRNCLNYDQKFMMVFWPLQGGLPAPKAKTSLISKQ